MSIPYIIVTLGPTGSGKTSLVCETINYLGLDSSFTKILVDDLVENNKNFKQKILEIIKDVESDCKKKGISCTDSNCTRCNTSEYYINPSKELLTNFNQAYFSIRKGSNCISGRSESCDDINELKLQEAFAKKENIVFETTGMEIPKWLLSGKPTTDNIWTQSGIPYICSENPYKIIFAYSIVSFDELIRRNTSRTLDLMNSFLQNPNMPAPRLPNIEKTSFRQIVSKIKNVLLDLYENCITSHDEYKCGKQKINNLLLFDNSGKEIILRFDSEKDKLDKDKFNILVNNLFKITEKLDGGIKNYKKKYLKYKMKYLYLKNNR